MKVVLVFAILVLGVVFLNVFGVDALVQAQAPAAQATLAPEVQNVVNQIHAAGCNAEEVVSANTISQLQKENASLKAQLAAHDPPKSGATKH